MISGAIGQVEIGDLRQLNWLWLIVGIFALVVLSAAWKRRDIARFATANLRDQIMPRSNRWMALVSTILLASTLLLLVICLVDVRWGKVRREVPQKGIEVIFALDLSRSMLARDVTPSRLDRAKQMIRDTVDEMAGDRVGLVVFAGEARQQIPLTSHHDDFKLRLDEVSPDDLSRGGSRLGEAIEVATDSFLDQTNDHKAIVLLTDGGDQESQPVEAARRAKQERGIRIFTIGLGDLEQGARIPVERGGQQDYLQYQGQQVWSKLDGEILQAIATESGGVYIPAGTKQVVMADVYHGYMANLEQQEFATARIDSYEARYQWLLAPAIALLLAEIWLSTRRQKSDRHTTSAREPARRVEDAA